jgi:hypothetical protein
MANSTLAIINSKNRLSESISSTNFSYNIGSAIEIQELAIKSISLPNTAYNITIYNNRLNYVNGGVPKVVILPFGQYDISTLITTLTTLMTSAGSPVIITQNPLTYKLKFEFVLATYFIIDTVSTLPNYIGFNLKNVSQFPISAVPTIIAPNVPNLQGTNNYYVASRTLGQGTNALLFNAIQNLSIIAVIPNTAPYGSIIHYTPPDILLDLKLYASKQNIQQIDIVILDTNFNIVDLNGSEVELCFKCYIKSRVEVFGK